MPKSHTFRTKIEKRGLNLQKLTLTGVLDNGGVYFFSEKSNYNIKGTDGLKLVRDHVLGFFSTFESALFTRYCEAWRR